VQYNSSAAANRLEFVDGMRGSTEVKMGGVNHCSLQCHLAKFRDLMINAKYGAVIGWRTPIT
jgi:hypothetical protein